MVVESLVLSKVGVTKMGKIYTGPNGLVSKSYEESPGIKLTDNEIETMKGFIRDVSPEHDGCVLVVRHIKKVEDAALFIPEKFKERAQNESVMTTTTATVVKTQPTYHNRNGDLVDTKFKPGDIVGFSTYSTHAPFIPVPHVQLLHMDDILFSMKKLPNDVTEPFGVGEFIETLYA